MLTNLPAAVPPKGQGTHFKARCPACLGTSPLQVTWKPEQQRYLLCSWQCPEGHSGSWLATLARVTGSDTYTLTHDPFGAAGLVIAETSSGSSGTSGDGSGPNGQGAPWGSFPSEWDVEQYRRALVFSKKATPARNWLTSERLISREVFSQYGLGWKHGW